MNKIKAIFFLGVMLLASSCQKDDMPEVVQSNDPVFTIKGKIGQEEVNIVAGDDNQYMYTGFDIRNRVDLFYGDISNENSSFKLTVHDGNLDNDKLALITNKPSFGFTRSAVQPTFEFAIDSFANSVKIGGIDWFVNGQFYSSNSITLYEHGIFDICAEVTFIDGETKTLCNEVILGYKKHAIGEPVHIVTNTGRLRVYNNTVFPMESISWYIDGQYISDALELSTTDYSGIVTVTAEITYGNGSTRTKSIVVDFDLQGRFIQDFSAMENINPLDNDYTLDMRFDINGEIWVSDIPENDTAHFEVNKYEAYKDNVDGIPVSIANGTINCYLKRLSDGMLREAELEMTFGFPENF